MPNKKPQNCWDFMKCPEAIKKDCEAFIKKMGRECWNISHINSECPSFQKHEDCFNCPWYIKLNPSS